MRDAAAECAACPDRIVRDVAHHRRKQAACFRIRDRTMKRSVANIGADGKGIVDLRYPRELGDAVDVNEMSRPRHTEGHDRNETLSAREDATVLRTEFGEHVGGFLDRSRNVTNERRGLHNLKLPAG